MTDIGPTREDLLRASRGDVILYQTELGPRYIIVIGVNPEREEIFGEIAHPCAANVIPVDKLALSARSVWRPPARTEDAFEEGTLGHDLKLNQASGQPYISFNGREYFYLDHNESENFINVDVGGAERTMPLDTHLRDRRYEHKPKPTSSP